jgi:Bacterial Ig-like domain
MTLRKTATGAKFGAVVSYDPATRSATLDPNLTLPANTQFTVDLGTDVADTAGNHLVPTTWAFTTGS